MKVTTTSMAVDAVIDALKAGVDEAGMRLVHHINGQSNAALIGKTVPADQILEIFRPDFAIRVWAACKPAGIDIPLRIHVYEQDAQTVVACRMPSDVFEPYDVDELMHVAAELDEIFTGILQSVSGT